MKKAKILIVDDDVDIINVLQTILENENYTVITANDKTEGLKKAKEEKPDLAILDVMMTTQYEGFEMAKELKENKMFSNMPIIMQTSIEIIETTKSSVQDMAREFRQDPKYTELQVILLKDIVTGNAGIDYRAEDGKSIWLPVNGFLRKPVDSSKLLPILSKLLS